MPVIVKSFAARARDLQKLIKGLLVHRLSVKNQSDACVVIPGFPEDELHHQDISQVIVKE